MKYIIYKDAFGYHGTQEKNYNSPVRDASEICDFTDFGNPEEIKQYLNKYTYLNPSDIVII